MITKMDIKNLLGGRTPKINLDMLVNDLNKTMSKYDINTPLRVQHFLAQVAHESDGFNTAKEYASGSAYEGREDLGNTHVGDGKRYKGRGLIQLTGRDNYKRYANDSGRDVLNSPETIENLANGSYADVAGWFWKKKGLNELADNNDVKGITKKINGGYNGLDARVKYLTKAKLFIKNLVGFANDNKGGLTVLFVIGAVLYTLNNNK